MGRVKLMPLVLAVVLNCLDIVRTEEKKGKTGKQFLCLVFVHGKFHRRFFQQDCQNVNHDGSTKYIASHFSRTRYFIRTKHQISTRTRACKLCDCKPAESLSKHTIAAFRSYTFCDIHPVFASSPQLKNSSSLPVLHPSVCSKPDVDSTICFAGARLDDDCVVHKKGKELIRFST